MSRLAFTTFAIMKAPYGDEAVRGFELLTPVVFEEAEQSPGFISRAKEVDDLDHLTNFERDWGAWGKFTVPRFYDGGYTIKTDTRASTLSLWKDITAVYDFVYQGMHRSALVQRQKWFRKPEWPTYATWWVADGHIPTWQEAAACLERLHDLGPTAVAFDFSRPFSADGGELPAAATRRPAASRRETYVK